MLILVIKGKTKKVQIFWTGQEQEFNHIKLELVHSTTNTEYLCPIDSSIGTDETAMAYKLKLGCHAFTKDKNSPTQPVWHNTV